ncbi:hypothetical protein [Paenibacillus herberti]|uniref:Uncharacterized protein n=1 Tax=Paenibacillus herberti TaxID=1619309 RepID=A0A229NYR9_9BACL|nr:hypothetical protein [Paenibacillus herberti]OXM14894.1 hypothetical protein CGZ75_18700 [Paenibacillus herberti]
MNKNKASKAEVQSTQLNQFQTNQDTEFSNELASDAQAAFSNENNNVSKNMNKNMKNNMNNQQNK